MKTVKVSESKGIVNLYPNLLKIASPNDIIEYNYHAWEGETTVKLSGFLIPANGDTKIPLEGHRWMQNGAIPQLWLAKK